MNPISAVCLGGVAGFVIGDPAISFPILPASHTYCSVACYIKADTIFPKNLIYKRDFSKTFYEDFKSSRVLKTNLKLSVLSGVAHYFLAKYEL